MNINDIFFSKDEFFRSVIEAESIAAWLAQHQQKLEEISAVFELIDLNSDEDGHEKTAELLRSLNHKSAATPALNLEILQDSIEKHNEERSILNSKSESLRHEDGVVRNKCAELKTNIQALEAKLAESAEELDAFKETESKLEELLSLAIRKEDELQKSISELDLERTNISAEKLEKISMYQKHTEGLKVAKMDLEILNNDVLKTKASLELAAAEISNSNHKLNELTIENQAANARLNELQKKNFDSENRQSVIESDVQLALSNLEHYNKHMDEGLSLKKDILQVAKDKGVRGLVDLLSKDEFKQEYNKETNDLIARVQKIVTAYESHTSTSVSVDSELDRVLSASEDKFR